MVRRNDDVKAFLQGMTGEGLVARLARCGLDALAFFGNAHMNALKLNRALFAFRSAEVLPLVGIGFKPVMDVDRPHAGNQGLTLFVKELRGDVEERHRVASARNRDDDADRVEGNKRELGARAP